MVDVLFFQLMLGPAFQSKVTTPATPISPHVGLPLANQVGLSFCSK